MLTIFTTAKPFTGHAGIIQRNALTSWTQLQPRPEILLFGNESGAAEIAQELGLRHVPGIARNEHGTPRLDALFDQAQTLSTAPILCYANADIILMSDFIDGVATVSRWRDRFLMLGRRWDVDLDTTWDFKQPQSALQDLARKRGKRRGCSFVDYFVFPRGLYQDIPPLAIGRTRWDHWLVWKAESMRVPIIDATWSVIAVHQNHEYAHPKGQAGIFGGEEAKRNMSLGGWGHVRTIEDATHFLRDGRIWPNLWHGAIVIKRFSRKIRRVDPFSEDS